jgi:ankyrin repeat protein
MSMQLDQPSSKYSYARTSGDPAVLVTDCQTPLTEAAQAVWDELVDESKLTPHVPIRPTYIEISLTNIRPCCGSKVVSSLPCKICGINDMHLHNEDNAFGYRDGRSTLSKFQLNRRDYFDNTPLHYAAASRNASLSSIKYLIHKGADILAKNTSGETFLHVLNVERIGGIKKYFALLKLLEDRQFPFSIRDYHGRTIAHCFFEAVDLKKIPTKVFEQIVSILKPDIYALDNLGHDFRHGNTWPQRKMKVWEDLCKNTPHFHIDFNLVLTTMPIQRSLMLEIDEGTTSVTWIDHHGDTLLVSLLKNCDEMADDLALEEIVKKIIEKGAEINMRDTNGDTALAVAVRRGFRPAAKALLAAGANPNTRSYKGVGILAQAVQEIQRATTDNATRLYARIFSCATLIIDHGAKDKPTVYDEYKSYEELVKRMHSRYMTGIAIASATEFTANEAA